MVDMNEQEIIYDWNADERVAPLTREPIQLHDETLRDGIQCPSVRDPDIEEKIELLHMMHDLGIHTADLGLPGAGPRAVADVTRLVREIVDQKLSVAPTAAARTHPNDIQPIIEIAQRAGRPIEVMAFIGASPIRRYAEDWDLDRMLRLTAEAIDMAVKEGLAVCFVTEDTVRSRPETLGQLFRCAVEHGASRLCLCDTVGHATPDGVRNLIHFTQSFVRGLGVDVGIDWHGHNDRGLALPNAIFAAEYGATRIHGTALGIGERVGNTAMDQLLINLRLLGELDNDLSRLAAYADAVSRAMEVPIPINYPVFGADAFRTTTGVHAAAIIKAERKGDAWLADRIYSGVPASLVGRAQIIEIGPMSGESNVIHWLRRHGVAPHPDLVRVIFDQAKVSKRALSEAELRAAIDAFEAAQAAPPPPAASS